MSSAENALCARLALTARGITLNAICGCALLACGSVADNDASFWTSSNDPGGKNFHGFEQAGTTGADQAGASGNGNGSGNRSGGDNGNSGSTGAVSGSSATAGAGNSNGAASGSGNGGSGSGAAGSAGTGPVGNSGPCAMSFQVKTMAGNGRYAPRNVGAIWIENGQNAFVKTLAAWGGVRRYNVTKWNAASAANTVDAVTGATLSNHVVHSVSWNCSDVAHNTVADGVYRLVMEFAEDNSGGFFGVATKSFTIEFPKGRGPQDISPPDQPNFSGMRLSLK